MEAQAQQLQYLQQYIQLEDEQSYLKGKNKLRKRFELAIKGAPCNEVMSVFGSTMVAN